MCRLAGYIGEPIPLQSLIIEPEHSLIEQSLEAQEDKLSVNGDGFGVASEPLTSNKKQWTAVAPSSVLILDGSALTSNILAAA